MLANSLLHTSVACVAAVIAIVAIWLHVRRLRQSSTIFKHLPQIAVGLAIIALLYLVYLSLTYHRGIDFSSLNMALLIALGMLIVVFFLNFMKKNDILTMAVLSLSAIVELIAIYVEPSSRVPVPVDPIFFLHIVLSAVSYAVLGLAAVQSMLFFELHRWLRSRDDLGKATLLPPLDFVETTNFRLILVGEILLTIAIVSAFFFYGELLDRLSYLPHVVLAVAAWLVYLVLLIGHYRLGWRSKCTYWSILAFLLVIACYIGLKILTPTIS